MRRVERHKMRLISFWDEEYPDLLRKIYDPPVLLFVRGAILRDDERALAIVGTRDATIYGERIAESIGRELARLGVTVVSGLARGIDTIAHRSVVQAKGRTIAVIGSGLDIPYPPENKGLMDTIAETGAVLSEFPLGTNPDAPNFPKRNRIISGLSLGTVVVESAEDGGAMITASTALDQNREVFAVPGPVTEKRSRGTNSLIRDGRAKLILSVDDILIELGSRLGTGSESTPHKLPPIDLTLFEQSLYDLLSDDPVHIDLLAERADTNTSDALVHLLSLEFKGLVRQLPGKQFVRA